LPEIRQIRDSQGELITSPATAMLRFNNRYKPDDIVVQLQSGTVTLIGGRDIKAEEFEFTLTAITPGSPMPSETTGSVRNGRDGGASIHINSFVFPGEISFTEDDVGVHRYTIRQVIPPTGTDGDENITYDNKTVTVTITVGRDMTTGKLTTTTVYTVGTGTVPNVVFENVFTPGSIDLPLAGTVALIGAELEMNQFAFRVTETDSPAIQADNNEGYYTPMEWNSRNDSDGGIPLLDIQLPAVGVYEFKAEQIERERDDGIYRDPEIFIVTVHVTIGDAVSGELRKEVTITRQSDGADVTTGTGILFVNRQGLNVTFKSNVPADIKGVGDWVLLPEDHAKVGVLHGDVLGSDMPGPIETATGRPGYVFLGWTTAPTLVKIVGGVEFPLDFDDDITGPHQVPPRRTPGFMGPGRQP
jgi:pilin isopeptide linkage protein